MALAGVQSVMDLRDKKALHPFFSKSQRIQSPERSVPSSVPNPENSDQDHNYESTDADLKSENGRKRGARKKGKRKGKDNPIQGKSNQASLERFTRQTKDARAAEDVTIVDMLREIASVEEKLHSLEEDPNSDRRKRRRTTSPTLERAYLPHAVIGPDTKDPIIATSSPPSWHEQLLFEATKGSGEVLVEASSPRSASPGSPGLPGVVPTTPPVNGQDEDTVMQSPLPSQAVNCPLPIEPQIDNAKDAIGDNNTTLESTPKKKLLRLNSNGKFSSPVSKEHRQQGDDTSKQTKGKNKSIKSLRSSIVIIKYGSDAESRSYLGNQIEQLIVGTVRKEKANTETSKGPSKPAGPPKPTHPFFLGKPNQRKEEPAPQIVASDCSRGSKSPRKSTVTPGKLRSQAQAMHSMGTSLSFGQIAGDSKNFKHPGMSEAPWPWKGIAHVRNLPDIAKNCARSTPSSWLDSGWFQKSRKLKRNAITVPAHEDLIEKNAHQLKPLLCEKVNVDDFPRGNIDFLRLPTRILTTGVTLQDMVQKEIFARFRKASPHSPDVLGKEIGKLQNDVHPALNGLFSDIEDTLTPFDKGECERQTWTQKYAPQCAADVLQLGKEATVLRDWLKNLSVIAVDSGKDAGRVKGRSGPKQKPVKKKRKKMDELYDFIVASDEDEMDELTDPEDLAPVESRHAFKKSLVRMGDQMNTDVAHSTRQKNVALLSGPHGCGKTAIVYAVAKEMGFEVFEINSTSRRSGKDVLDKVGDMSENHLVNHQSKEPKSTAVAPLIDSDQERVADALQRDLESGRQGTMTSFFKPSGHSKHKPKAKPLTKMLQKDENNIKFKAQKSQHQQHHQKQSLILLEEVDVLFDEDKQFWVTVLTLATQSKRPIVMTCNDENLVPIDSLPLHAILRLSPPPVDLAADYLLLLAAKEGHILDRDSVSNLYKSRDHDLRASITDLDFWCQMSVGDRKGGLEWTYQRWPPGKDVDEHGRVIRVASKGTYQSGMGWFSRDTLKSADLIGFDKEEELLLEAWDSWGIHPESWSRELLPTTDQEALTDSFDTTPENNSGHLDTLKRTELLLDCVSAADIYCRVGLPSGSMEMDATQPPLPEKARFNYIEGYPFLSVDPAQDYSNLDTSIVIRTHLSVQRCAAGSDNLCPLYRRVGSLLPIRLENFTTGVLAYKTRQWTQNQLSRPDFSQAFDPLAEPPTTAPLHASPNQLIASSFDRNFRIITEDLAPYVRSIVAHDLRLEADRVRMSNLLSEGGNNKRMRTTRASRSALEGGRRETKRRERWFDKRVNMTLVMKTAGKSWTGMCLKAEDAEMEELELSGSVRSSDED